MWDNESTQRLFNHKLCSSYSLSTELVLEQMLMVSSRVFKMMNRSKVSASFVLMWWTAVMLSNYRAILNIFSIHSASRHGWYLSHSVPVVVQMYVIGANLGQLAPSTSWQHTKTSVEALMLRTTTIMSLTNLITHRTRTVVKCLATMMKKMKAKCFRSMRICRSDRTRRRILFGEGDY